MTGALISIRPRFAQDILAGTKTTELRRRAPACKPGDVVVMYETSPTKAIVGIAIVEGIDDGPTEGLWKAARGSAGVSREEYRSYFSGVVRGSAIRLSGARPLRRPIPLAEAQELAPDFRPPQSWCYLSGLSKALAARIRSLDEPPGETEP